MNPETKTRTQGPQLGTNVRSLASASSGPMSLCRKEINRK